MGEYDDGVAGQLRPDMFAWNVRQVHDWLGGTEFMIEILGMDGCASFGRSVREAKAGLREALYLWIERHGHCALPQGCEGAQVIILEEPMSAEEVSFINNELKSFKDNITQYLS